MVIDQTCPLDLFRSLRTQISSKGLRAFKVLKLKDSVHAQCVEQTEPVRHNRRFTDSQLVTIQPKQ